MMKPSTSLSRRVPGKSTRSNGSRSSSKEWLYSVVGLNQGCRTRRLRVNQDLRNVLPIVSLRTVGYEMLYQSVDGCHRRNIEELRHGRVDQGSVFPDPS